MTRKYRWVFLLFLMAGLAQAAWYYPRLPGVVAVHFDINGQPNGWSGPGMFFVIELGLLLLLCGLALWSPIRRGHRFFRPKIPNSDYWLHGDRKQQSLEWLARCYQQLMLASLALMLVVSEMVLRANLSPPVVLDSNWMWILLSAYFLFVAVWVWRLFARFRKPPGAGG